jgi:uncharacterized membrane protein
MSLVFLGLAIAALWINLLGTALAARRFIDDYPVARVAGVIAICLVCFFVEHFWGWGPRPPLLPFTTAASVWLIWRNRSVLRRNWTAEALFGAGFFYCLAWRYTFPDIDSTGEKMPNLAMIEGYMRGTRLPPPDAWMAPFRLNFYYSFQHYGASLLGRILDVGPGVSYHLAYCTLAGLIALLCGTCVARLCPWAPGRVVGILSLFFGGSGAVVAAHVLLRHAFMYDSLRFLGGAIVHGKTNPLGLKVALMMSKPGVDPRDLPMEPLSYVLTNGDYHPPLAGYMLLALAATLIASLATETDGRRRNVCHALLGATVPVALISNAWVFPLQLLLVGGWFVYRAVSGDRGYLIPGLAGAAAAIALEYPYLVEFTHQAIGNNAAFHITESINHTPWLGWCLTFWPVVGVIVLGFFNRDRRPLTLFLIAIWVVELAVTEWFYNHDVYGGAWIRFNTTLKWWPWVYAGIILTLGASNLGSSSRLCRYGTLLMLVPTLAFAYDLGYQFVKAGKGSMGKLDGYAWIDDPVVRDTIVELGSRPDGIAVESGLAMANTESPAVTLFGGKLSLLGWPWHETTWRGPLMEIRDREDQIDAFYSGTMADPMRWLLHNNVRYVLWLTRDNKFENSRFLPLCEQIKQRYFWHHMYGDDRTLAVGFWERVDVLPARAPVPAH